MFKFVIKRCLSNRNLFQFLLITLLTLKNTQRLYTQKPVRKCDERRYEQGGYGRKAREEGKRGRRWGQRWRKNGFDGKKRRRTLSKDAIFSIALAT